MTNDATTYYRTQIATYTDSIRMADFKANVAIIYGAFTIGLSWGSARASRRSCLCLRCYYLLSSSFFASLFACFRDIRAPGGPLCRLVAVQALMIFTFQIVGL